ncbi:MAG: AAA family ATPase, partial [Actinomycetota bacterium]
MTVPNLPTDRSNAKEPRVRQKEQAASQSALLEGSLLVREGRADVFHLRERAHMKKLVRAIVLVGLIDVLLYRLWASGFALSLPHFGPEAIFFIPPLVMLIAIIGMPLVMLLNGRSPHITVYPEQVETALTEIKGLDNQVDEVIRSIDAFLGYATFKEELGGTPRRGILFEGPPGTGKTFLAKAMAKQAGVPFLFIPAPAFQSMWQGMSAFRIRSFFRKLRKAARKEGGAIGFIEEID